MNFHNIILTVSAYTKYKPNQHKYKQTELKAYHHKFTYWILCILNPLAVSSSYVEKMTLNKLNSVHHKKRNSLGLWHICTKLAHLLLHWSDVAIKLVLRLMITIETVTYEVNCSRKQWSLFWLSEAQKLCRRRYRHSRQKLVRFTFTLFISYHIISPTFAKAPLTQCSTAPYNTTHRVLLKKIKK